MLTVLHHPWRLLFRERLGLRHAPQVIRVPAPPGVEQQGLLLDAQGRRHSWQRSRQDPTQVFLYLSDGLAADAELMLTPQAGTVEIVVQRHAEVLGNGRFRLLLNEAAGSSQGGIHPGPLRGMALGDGPWRGRSLLDTRAADCRWSSRYIEDGPLRCVWQWRAELGSGHYTCTITVDAGLDFAQFDEDFSGGAADQLLIDLSGDDLPTHAWILGNDGGHRRLRFDTCSDHRLGAVWCWTQMSQMSPNTDGIGFEQADGTVIAVVAMRGGSWRGNRLNHVEAWVRRWHGDDPQTRRGWPAEAKYDATFSDGIPARGTTQCRVHAGFEAWIGGGRRCSALVIGHSAALTAKGGANGAGAWADKPLPASWAAVQGGLRRIHTQHGLLPLEDQLAWVLEWPQESGIPQLSVPVLNHYHTVVSPVNGELDRLADYLAARLHGCWYGAGLEEANPVVGRPLPLAMLSWSPRFSAGLDDARVPRLRAFFAALAYLNASDACYPAAASMRPHGDPDGFEPTLRGMANQNFLTDVIMVHGAFAEAFPAHPCAAAWRDRSALIWQRQLAFHAHPESGVWEESHTYFQHVLVTVLAPLQARRDAGHGDGFANPALHRLLSAAVAQLTPADRRYDGARCLLPIGDHYPETQRYREGWHFYAEAVAPYAPLLAAELRWCYLACGGTAPCRISPREPACAHRHLTGLGVLWRGSDELITLRTGGAWGHHHQDDGALLVWGCGQQLVADAGSAGEGIAGMRKHGSEGHSRWAPRDWEPLNHLDRHNRGQLIASELGDPLPWAIAWCPTRAAVIRRGEGALSAMADTHYFSEPIRHMRLVVKLGPGALLVVDRAEAREPAIIRWHLCGSDAELLDANIARLGLPDRHALWLLTQGAPLSLGPRDLPKNFALATQELRCHAEHSPLIATLLIWGGDHERPQWDAQGIISHAQRGWRIAIKADSVQVNDLQIHWPDYPA